MGKSLGRSRTLEHFEICCWRCLCLEMVNKQADTSVPISSLLLQATKTYSFIPTGAWDRTELSYPSPALWLNCPIGMVQAFVSVSKSHRGHGDKGELWTSKAPKWNQWSGIVWPHTTVGKASDLSYFGFSSLCEFVVVVGFLGWCIWLRFCLFVCFWEGKFWLNFWGNSQFVLWELLHIRVPYISTAWCPGSKFIQKSPKFYFLYLFISEPAPHTDYSLERRSSYLLPSSRRSKK